MWLLVLGGLFVVVSLVLLSQLCVHCHRGPLTSISQSHTSEDTYIPSTQFRIHRPMQMSTETNYSLPPQLHLSPQCPGEAQRRAGSYKPTETESNNSYENQDNGSYVNEQDDKDDAADGYILVIPEGEPPTNQSRASSHTSEDHDNDHDYVNFDPQKSDPLHQSQTSIQSHDGAHLSRTESPLLKNGDSASDDYINVESSPEQTPVCDPSLDSDSDSESDDDEGNYVNTAP